MKNVHTGKDHSIWQINKNKNGLVEQMLPLKCIKAFKREYQNNHDIQDIGGWDCDCGIYVIGKSSEVEKAFEELLIWMKSRTDREIINDLVTNDGLSYLGVFKSTKQDISIIVGGGYYEETDEGLLNILNTLENVSVGEIGANYTSDQDLYRTLLDDIDYIDYKKTEKLNPMHVALMSEVFEYWETNDIYTKKERIDEGLMNVDKVIKKYRKNQ